MTQCLASKRTGQVKAGREVQSRSREHGFGEQCMNADPF